METKALVPLARLPLVPTSFPKPKTAELEKQLERRGGAIAQSAGNTFLMAGMTALMGCLLSCAWLHAPVTTPFWAFMALVGLFLVSSGALGLCFRQLVADACAFSRLKPSPQLRAEAANEARLSDAAWTLNGNILDWNGAAALAERTEGLEPKYLACLHAKRAVIEKARQSALRLLALRAQDP